MRILYVTPYVPSPIRTRPYNLIRALTRLGHRITLLTAAGNSAEEQEQANELRDWGVQVEIFSIPRVRMLSNCLLALPTREPLQAVYSYHRGMEQRLRELSRSGSFDVVHIEHLRAARLARAVGDAAAVYDSVDCISLLFEQATQNGAQLRSRLMAAVDLARTRRYEAQLLTRYDQVVITSRRDKKALQELARRHLPTDAHPAPITVVTNGVDLEYFRPPETRFSGPVSPPTIVFTGKMSYHANVAAALYFAREVLPHVWAKDPRVQFQIVGQNPPEAVRQLAADERIQVTGYVSDLRPYLAQASVAVCPVLYAVGIQNKVLEAMAMGTPIVCTPAAFAGLEARAGKVALVADRPDVFATQVMQIYSNPTLAKQLTAAGRRYVETHHSWKAQAQILVQVYEKSAVHV